MEKILKIEPWNEEEDYFDEMSGYAITTDQQIVKLLIDDWQQCCESWGYFMSEDDFDYFVGAELFDIEITNTELKAGSLKQNEIDVDSEYFEGDVMFVNIITSNGTLQFVAYNEHNGYYGHEAKVVSKQLNHEEIL